MIRLLILALALVAGVSSAAQAQLADVVQVCGATSGIVTPLGPGGRLTRDVNGSLCVTGISGGGGGGGTVTQGAAATDTAANRWPVLAYQGGAWTVALGAGSATVGSIANTAFGISGTLPAFAATPTFNVGTTGGIALDATVTARLGTLGQKAMSGSAPVVIASDQTAVPVASTTLSTAANQATEIAQLTAANQRSSYVFEANNVAVTSGTPQTGNARDAGASPSAYTRCSTMVSSTAAGTLYQDQNPDGSVWIPVAQVAVTANVPQTLTMPIMGRYCRERFLPSANGTATALSALTVN